MAERFKRPILTFIDTPGAYPGIGAEERGQAEAIAKNLLVMSKLGVPIVATVIGEGGSGGALAIGVANRVLMMENAIYSVISPEACASILWRDSTLGPKAADALKYTAEDCLRLGVADEVIGEPTGGAHRDPGAAMDALSDAVARHLEALVPLDGSALREDRYRRFRGLGVIAPSPAP
jgi:acetyl-CoA carboxylase carboxyl transferase subunit alpha